MMPHPNTPTPARFTRPLNRAALWCVWMLASSTALAQSSGDLKLPKTDVVTAPAAVFSLIVLALLAAMLIFAAAFPTKRGHMD